MVTAATVLFVGITAVRLVQAAPRSGGWHWVLLALAAASVRSPRCCSSCRSSPPLRLRPPGPGGGDPRGRRWPSAATGSAAATPPGSRSGCCVATAIATSFVVFLLANDHAVQRTFFAPDMVTRSWWDVTKAFGKNVFISVIAEVLVLAWGLLVAIARLVPGPGGPADPHGWPPSTSTPSAPAGDHRHLPRRLRPAAGRPAAAQRLSPTWAAIFALTLTYGAYVAEVYRAGIESIHWSQVAAARSLGLSYPPDPALRRSCRRRSAG